MTCPPDMCTGCLGQDLWPTPAEGAMQASSTWLKTVAWLAGACMLKEPEGVESKTKQHCSPASSTRYNKHAWLPHLVPLCRAGCHWPPTAAPQQRTRPRTAAAARPLTRSAGRRPAHARQAPIVRPEGLALAHGLVQVGLQLGRQEPPCLRPAMTCLQLQPQAGPESGCAARWTQPLLWRLPAFRHGYQPFAAAHRLGCLPSVAAQAQQAFAHRVPAPLCGSCHCRAAHCRCGSCPCQAAHCRRGPRSCQPAHCCCGSQPCIAARALQAGACAVSRPGGAL